MSLPPSASDRFAVAPSATTPLGRLLAERIRADGPLPFDRFMTEALYHPSLGYYRSGRPTVGRDGDFLTSPEVHPLFGYAVATLIADVWDALARPTPFTVRDVGPGTGALAEQIATWCAQHRPNLAAALRVELVERSEIARAQQAARLATFGEPVHWLPDLAEAPPMEGVVVGNELLDAQPVRRFRWTEGRWMELCVDLDSAGRFVDAPTPCDADRNGADLGRDALPPVLRERPGAAGQTVEVCPSVGPLITELARPLARGLLLLFDYGYARERLYASWRRDGTLMTFHRHTPGDDPYARVGEQDLTCHVDTDAVTDAVRAAGLTPYAEQSQAEWLAATGALTASAPSGAGAALDAQLARRRAAATLSDPGGLGRIRVLASGRSLGSLPSLGHPEGDARAIR